VVQPFQLHLQKSPDLQNQLLPTLSEQLNMAFQGFFFFLQVMQERFRFLFGFVDDELSFFFGIFYEGSAGLLSLQEGTLQKRLHFPIAGDFLGERLNFFAEVLIFF
jgi:hypothetical protein